MFHLSHPQFVEEHFDAEGTELETWLPEDWTSEPDFISQLRKPGVIVIKLFSVVTVNEAKYTRVFVAGNHFPL